MYAVPRHLQKIFRADKSRCDDHSLDGDICCDCGCDRFRIKLFAHMDDGNVPTVCEYKDHWAFVIKIICMDCKKEWLLFDLSLHGYNGYVCHDGVTIPVSELTAYHCPDCGEDIFEVTVGIEVEDKEQFIEEVVQEDPDHFTGDDYVDAFDWFQVGLTCSGCGKVTDRWVDLETA